MPWLGVMTKVLASFNYHCTHQNFCHPQCYRRQMRAAKRIMEATRHVRTTTKIVCTSICRVYQCCQLMISLFLCFFKVPIFSARDLHKLPISRSLIPVCWNVSLIFPDCIFYELMKVVVSTVRRFKFCFHSFFINWEGTFFMLLSKESSWLFSSFFPADLWRGNRIRRRHFFSSPWCHKTCEQKGPQEWW